MLHHCYTKPFHPLLTFKSIFCVASYLAQVTDQPGVCRWLAEAGELLCVPGMAHQKVYCPNHNHRSQACSHHSQDMRHAVKAEEQGETTLEDRHAGAKDKPFTGHKGLFGTYVTVRRSW